MRILFSLVPTVMALGQVPATFEGCPAAVQDLLKGLQVSHNLTGIQFALTQQGSLTCAAAIGYADSSTQRAITPTTLMRIGSVSKTITGMAIAKLLDDGKIRLDDKAVNFVPDLQPPAGFADARWRNVTLLNMLQHSMGWDRAVGGEPIQMTVSIAATLGIRAPATSTDVIRWLLAQKLHFEPGTKASYTGVEYSFLAVIVERVSGVPYEQFVRENILAPANVRTSMRVGRTLPEGRAFPDKPAYFETVYYSDEPPVKSVFPYITGTVEHPYGEWYQEALEGSGGWTANAPALLRYVNKIFGRPNLPPLFKAETIQAIEAKPTYESGNPAVWYGVGWQIVPVPSGFQITFSGGIRGTISNMRYFPNGNSYAFIANTSSESDPDALTDIANQLFTNVGPLPATSGNLFNNAKYIDSTTRLPTIRPEQGVVQGASFQPGVTAGSWFSILGWYLGTTTRPWDSSDFTKGDILPTKLDGVEVKINGKSAAVSYVSPTQINAQVPNITDPGTATLQIIRDGVGSHPEPIEIRASSPEFFRYFAGGKAYVAALHKDGSTVADPAVLKGLRAAAAGETIQIFGTGFAVAPAGRLVKSVTPVAGTTVKIGTATANVSFSGLTATGLFQANVEIPALPAGDYPVSLTVNGVPNLVVGIVPVR